MLPQLRIAREAAASAGRILRYNFKRVHKLNVWEKSRNNPVSQVDRDCEKEIVDRITRAYPDHGVVAEEGASVNPRAEVRWIIDPLDGTRNFIHGIPHFAVSIALMNKREPLLGVVYDPVRDEMFCAERGEGATLNQTKMRVSGNKTIARALIATGMPYREDQDAAGYLKTLDAIITSGANIRRMGAAALDLCYVAHARFDAFWEFGLRQWDIAAGVLIVREAGGMVGALTGADETMFDSGNVLATNSHLFERMRKLCQSCKM